MTHQEHLLGFSFGRNRAIEREPTANLEKGGTNALG